MALRKIYPKPETFGTLGFLGFAEQSEVTAYEANRRVVTHYRYALFSDVQTKGVVEVIVPAQQGKKQFDYEQVVTLVNPVLNVASEVIQSSGRAYVKWILEADDIVLAK